MAMKHAISLLLLCSVLSTNQSLSQASLVKDINTEIIPSQSWPDGFKTYNGNIYYSDEDDIHGRELWRSDGTPEGTMFFKDISPGISSSNPSSFVEMNGILYFVAIDVMHGSELWRTDGTAEGTFMVKDINPGSAGSFAQSFTAMNNTLYMVAYHREFGRELWRSDGTSEGTFLVKDIYTGIGSCYAYYLVNLNGMLLFNAKDEQHGEELWRSDGTEEGTNMVRDIGPGARSSRPLYVTKFKDRVYFAVDTAFNGVSSKGKQIWTSDGTTDGTSMFLSNHFDGRYNSYHNLLAADNHLYFEAFQHSGNGPLKLWKTDGTNTYLIEESTETTSARLGKIVDGNLMYTYYFFPDALDLSNIEFHVVVISDVSGEVIFDENFAYQKDPEFSTYVLKVEKFTDNSFVFQLTKTEDLLLAGDPQNLRTYVYLIKIEKDAGSTLIGTFSLASALSSVFNGKILFGASAEQQPDDMSLYETDGTTEGTSIIKNNPTARSSSPHELTVFKDQLVFAADANSGVWVSDGTGPGTVPVEKDFTFTEIANMVATNDAVYMSASTPLTGHELWKTDGTSSGTVLVKDFIPGEADGEFLYLTALQNQLVFIANDPDAGVSLWKTNGTNTELIKDLSIPLSYHYVSKFVKNTSGNVIYFDFNDSVHGAELWKTDGTAEGTVLVKDIVPGNGGSIINGFYESIMADDILYFRVEIDGEDELWKSDGTEAGTIKLKDFTGELYSHLLNFRSYQGNKLLFTNSNLSLWISDGTPDGTVKLRDFSFEIIDGNASGPQIHLLSTLGDKGYFFKGIELWETNGTPEGTRFITNFDDHPYTDAYISEVKEFDNRILFPAVSQDGALYLWSTDGTAAGTRKIPGVKNVWDLEVMHGVLYFRGQGPEGTELWRYVTELPEIPGEPEGPGTPTSVESNINSDVQVYPNPSSGSFTIAAPGNQVISKIELIDSFGRKTSYSTLFQRESEVHLKIEKEISGLYLLSMQIGDKRIVKKIIRQ